jgi:hypothetical protein
MTRLPSFGVPVQQDEEMTMTLIPECAHQISDEAYSCPQCGKPIRPQPTPFGYGYEYRSKETLFGWPLVHIATGIDPSTGRKRIAKGIIAIGDVAIGGVAIGGCAMGGFALGGLALGLVTLGGMSIALLLAVGGGAISTGVAIGGGALGYYALGGGAIGPHALGSNWQDPDAVEFFSDWLGDWVHQLARRRF